MSDGRAFLGRGWKFPPEFSNRDRAPAMVSEEEDVSEAIRILLGTSPGERVMHPTYGCGLRGMVFEVLDAHAVTQIQSLIERAILFHEPRVRLDRVDVRLADALGGRVDIDLGYTIRETNTRSNLVYPFYLAEGTNLGGLA